jgi:hypothetical protein
MNEDEKKKVMQSQGVKFQQLAEEAPAPQVKKAHIKKERKKSWGLPLLVFILLGVLSYGAYRGRGYLHFLNVSNFTSGESASDYKKTIEEVGKLVALPSGEDPTVATVTSLEPLRGQEFFKDAKVGDKVLIFSKSKKAILYRPSEKRIIAMAPLDS